MKNEVMKVFNTYTGLWQFANKKIASKPYIYAIYKIKYFVL